MPALQAIQAYNRLLGEEGAEDGEVWKMQGIGDGLVYRNANLVRGLKGACHAPLLTNRA